VQKQGASGTTEGPLKIEKMKGTREERKGDVLVEREKRQVGRKRVAIPVDIYLDSLGPVARGSITWINRGGASVTVTERMNGTEISIGKGMSFRSPALDEKDISQLYGYVVKAQGDGIVIEFERGLEKKALDKLCRFGCGGRCPSSS